MSMRFIKVALVLVSLQACSAVDKKPPVIALEKNVVDISVTDFKVCKQVKLYHKTDGSLWIGNPNSKI